MNAFAFVSWKTLSAGGQFGARRGGGIISPPVGPYAPIMAGGPAVGIGAVSEAPPRRAPRTRGKAPGTRRRGTVAQTNHFFSTEFGS
jgi:hypothetical protein